MLNNTVGAAFFVLFWIKKKSKYGEKKNQVGLIYNRTEKSPIFRSKCRELIAYYNHDSSLTAWCSVVTSKEEDLKKKCINFDGFSPTPQAPGDRAIEFHKFNSPSPQVTQVTQKAIDMRFSMFFCMQLQIMHLRREQYLFNH